MLCIELYGFEFSLYVLRISFVFVLISSYLLIVPGNGRLVFVILGPVSLRSLEVGQDECVNKLSGNGSEVLSFCKWYGVGCFLLA